MKIAVVSDVHGNLAALEAVVKDLASVKPDLVVHGGDLALNGPKPAECIDLVRELGWPGVRGNADAVLVDGKMPLAYRLKFPALVKATAEMIGGDRIAWLSRLPAEWRDGRDVALVHAVPGDLWPIVRHDAPDATLTKTYGKLGAAVAVYGHIHHQYVRTFPGLTVANSGSVGRPFDGDWRSAYVVVADGKVEMRRVEYDLERELADLRASGYPGAGALAEGQRTGKP